MFAESEVWTQLMIVIGEVAVLAIGTLLITAMALAVIAFYSISNGTFYFPRLLKSGLVLLEGLVKAICKLLGLDDRDLLTFFINLHNAMNSKAFSEIPIHKRAIFLPQCLRSSRCPGHLTPEGIVCKNCGGCGIGEVNLRLQAAGYRVFIMPGSTFIKRMVKKYRPTGVIGVGCLMEVKEGLEMCDRMGLVAMGIVTLKDGCVETLVNWNDVFDVASMGVEPRLNGVDLHGPAD
ncbi:MAG: DUF116 domain-containing protein [Methanomicrobiaceae archaeon]|uniref:DUF116 domain-containing protein n=1 Tax=hydrocarbon metagenome TaxID=938273 RepID=A0A0W8FFB0_9ZZZZ|nr:DUF116 domain-containing protein [Methanomicrobiaceae archaeon]MDD5420336.1 DUF116 domain-containing protein [Methanomicrobiaceae archaeon]